MSIVNNTVNRVVCERGSETDHQTNTLWGCALNIQQIPIELQHLTVQLSEAAMSKEVQVSIKVESDLRGRFMAVAADRRRTAAQIIRDLMRLYIADSEAPNALIAGTTRKGRKGEDVFRAASASDLFKRLGI